MRRRYPLLLVVNSRVINEIIIDSHYEIRHSKSVNDEMILELVRTYLDGGTFPEEQRGPQGHEYFAIEPLYYHGKPYRLVWLLPPGGDSLGVVNCYRRSYGKGKKRIPE